MIVLSGFIWDIHIEGNQMQTDDVIYDFLAEQDIRHGIRKSSVDCKLLAAEFRKAFDNFIWVSVKIQGTRLLIDVKENTDLTIDEKTDYGPSDLISNVNGTVKEIITRSGTPLVKAGDVIKKGQPLVLGQVAIYDDAGEVSDYQYCAADADIYVETTYRYKQSLSMKYIKKEYTGKEVSGGFLRILNKGFAFTGRRKSEGKFDAIQTEHQLRLFEHFYLPVHWGKIRCREYKLVEKTYTKEEAVRKSQGILDKFLFKNKEKGVQILENNVKIEAGLKNCTAEGIITFIEKAGKRVERNLGE